MKKANYLSYLYRFAIFLPVFLLFAGMASAQSVKLVEVLASKTYPEGNQITYFTVTEMPTGQDEIDFMKQYVIENTEVTRLVIFPDQPRCMFDGDEDLDIEKVVAAMNEACLEWKKNQKD